MSAVPASNQPSAPEMPRTASSMRSFSYRHGMRLALLVVLAIVVTGLSSCHSAAYYYYKFPADTYAGRPIPPSKLAERVMISVSANGTVGSLQIVDAKRDIRSNVEDTIPSFQIGSYGSGFPSTIFNFPAELRGYVYSASDGSLTNINYSTESSAGTVGTFQTGQNSIGVPPTFTRYYGAESSAGILEIIDNQSGGSYGLNIPNVYRVAVNKGDTVALAMVRNSNIVYRVFKLNQNQFLSAQDAIAATGSADCEPQVQPVYCAVQVPGTFDRPANVYFSLDGTTAYVLNCGPECGGTTASITLLQQGPLNTNVIPTSTTQPNPQIANVPVPGGATVALSDGKTLYIAGQQQQPDGLFEGFLSTMDQASNTITNKYPISDGTHTKMLFADNNTLWIGSQYCATGERQKLGLNYNCLTRVVLGSTLSPQIVPNVTPGSPSSTVPYPNQNNNQWYYGNLTGLCWVQTFNKVYTAYGGQVHIFSTVDGSEIDNSLVTVQGTALDVAYMDAVSDDAN
ncbi:MAG TPA: hypothetical protein VG714_07780 [Acidobacteriaceae bacterium]|nr:hypothetical protein [Acidobacteriaceae bacterium]